jgi:molybdenum cofactor cytidylyltransferase
MIFGRLPLADAKGGILAHNLKTADRVIRKGALLDAASFELLAAAGYDEVTVLHLEPGDVPEGEAATRLGEALLTPNLRRSKDVHGRVNILADADGLLRLDVRKIDQLNMVDESITLATLPDRSVVAKGDMIATLKIIPFAVAGSAMAIAEALICQGTPAFTLKPFLPLKIGLVLTQLSHLKEATINYTIEVTKARVELRGGTLLPDIKVPHEVARLTSGVNELLRMGADVVLISGASAVTDRHDVAPMAIIGAGGEITHFGMPVDPGNLICFGKIGHTDVIVLPGCARSPKENGFDWVLDLIFAGDSAGSDDITRMGVGGLLKEIETRPAPREREQESGFGIAPKSKPRVAALVLAAGLSSRMAPHNKLLAVLPNGKRMITETVERALASTATPVIVVTGHQDQQIREALTGLQVRFVYAPDYAEGMAASIRAGIAAMSATIGAALICLGDMPLVEPSTLDQIIAAYDTAEGREIIIPTHDGQRGNPILWGRQFFVELLHLAGDAGARQVLYKHMEYVSEVTAESDAVLRDFDTPETLMPGVGASNPSAMRNS